MTATWLSSGGKPFNFSIKPPVPTIDWSNPLTKGLVCAVDYSVLGGSSAEELVAGVNGAFTGTTPSVGPYGAQRSFNGNTDQDLYTLAPSQIIPTGGQISGEVLFINNGLNVGSNGNTILSKGNLVGSQPFFNMRYNPGTPANIELYTFWNGSFASWQINPNNLNNNQWYHVVMTYDYGNSSNVPIFYVNGVQQAVNVGTAPSGSPGADDGSLFFGNTSVGGGTRGLNGCISHGRCWNRILLPGEVLSLYQNPWQIYRAPVSHTFVSGGVSYVLGAAQGTFAETGQVVSLKVARLLSVIQGSFALAGQAATLRHGYTLTAGQGSFVESGGTVLFGIRMPVAQGSIAAAGQAAGLVWTTAGAHTFTLAGAFGSFALTGEPVALKAARKFGVSNGAFGLTGKAAGLARGKNVVAAQGGFVFTGKPVAFHVALSIKAQCGTLALASEAAGLIRSGWTVVDPDMATWTPQISAAFVWSRAEADATFWTSKS